MKKIISILLVLIVLCGCTMLTILAYHRQSGQTYVVDTVFAMHHGRNGQSGVSAGEQALADVAYGQRYCIEGCTLSSDNATAGLLNEGFNFIMVDGSIVTVADSAVVQVGVVAVDRNIGDVRNRPRNEGSIAVFTEYVCVYVLLVDVVVFGQTSAQSCGIQNSTGTDDAVFGKSGELVEGVGQNVNRVSKRLDMPSSILSAYSGFSEGLGTVTQPSTLSNNLPISSTFGARKPRA